MGADEKEEAMHSLRACISSRKGGVPFHELNREYKELVGEYIPFGKLGYENLLSFLRDVPGVSVDEKDCMVRSEPTATTVHLHELIKKQKDVKKFNSRYRPYKNTKPLLKSKTNTQQNQPKPKPLQKAPLQKQQNQQKRKPLQKAPLQKTSQSNNSSRGSYSQAKQSQLGQYPYEQTYLNAIYENELRFQFDELVMRYHNNGLWNNYKSYCGQYQNPTYITQQFHSYQIQQYPYYTAYNQQPIYNNQNRYGIYDYYDTYRSKYPTQYNNREQRKYQPYNKKSKDIHYISEMMKDNTFECQYANSNNKWTNERCVQVQLWNDKINVQYKPFDDDSIWLNNDSMLSGESVNIGEYQVIGDALILQLLGSKQSELCDHYMTIKEATYRVTKYGCSNKVLIALGTIDILNGAGYDELTWNMQLLIDTVVSAGGYPVICTVPPMSGIRGNYYAISALVAFNKWLRHGLKPTHIINFNDSFYAGGRINFKLFLKPSTNFLQSIWPLALWTQEAMGLVSKLLIQNLLATGTA